jgi:hypothetical protein
LPTSGWGDKTKENGDCCRISIAILQCHRPAAYTISGHTDDGQAAIFGQLAANDRRMIGGLLKTPIINSQINKQEHRAANNKSLQWSAIMTVLLNVQGRPRGLPNYGCFH